jgi:AraC family transcriptional regulator
MDDGPAPSHRLEAEITTAAGGIEVVRRSWVDAIDIFGSPDRHRIELSLLPRSRDARGCFPERWGPHRFEPIGELFLLPAGQLVHAKSECRQQSSIVCTFAPAAAETWLDRPIEWTDGRLQAGLDIANPTIRGLLFRLGEEVRQPGFASGALVELMIAQLAIELARHCLGIEEKAAIGGLAPWRLRRIDDRLAVPGEAPSLAELAKLCDLSVRQLTRGFRASRGGSIGDHIADSRIQLARQLLGGDRDVKSVAHALGFASPTNFSAAFRRSTGENPRQYRQRAVCRPVERG